MVAPRRAGDPVPRTRLTRGLASTLVALGCAATILVGAEPALAHDGTDGAIVLTVTDQRILGTAQVAFAELGYRDTTGDGLMGAEELGAQQATVAPNLVSILRDHAALEIDGRKVEILGAGMAPVSQGQDLVKYVEIVFATGPHDGEVSRVDVSWSFTSPVDQVVLSEPEGLVSGRLGDDGTTSVTLDAASTVRSFFLTGIDHVRSGLDHMLFLVVLTLAVVGSTISRATIWRVVKLVTAFTLGHATSLCLAYFDLVSIPAQWVEPAISLSIVAAAVLALRGKGTSIRPWGAASVGLVHGLGFASSLGGLGLVTTDELGALAAFNIGIDVAQTAVVLVVIFGTWVIRRVLAGHHHWVRIAVCGGAGLVGLGWTAALLAA